MIPMVVSNVVLLIVFLFFIILFSSRWVDSNHQYHKGTRLWGGRNYHICSQRDSFVKTLNPN